MGEGPLNKARVEAFSDGVIAVAITLLALDLRVPAPGGAGSLAHRLAEEWPDYAAYVVSFVTIGIIWINHHAMFRRLVRVDHTVLVLNLLLLLTVVELPFSTALMAAYLRSPGGRQIAAVVYGGSFLLMTVAFFLLQRHVLVSRHELLHQHLTPKLRRTTLRRNAVGLLPYTVATVGGLISPYLTLVICGVIAGFYALPATTGVGQPDDDDGGDGGGGGGGGGAGRPERR